MEYGYARASTNSDKQDIGRQKREFVEKNKIKLIVANIGKLDYALLYETDKFLEGITLTEE